MIKPACAIIAAAAFNLSMNLSAATAVDPSITITDIVHTGSIIQPTCMAFLEDTDILVGEKASGRVKRVINGIVNTTPVLDLAVNFAGERGLLGMTLDPQFSINQFVYVFYTRSSTANDTSDDSVADQRISRFTWNGSSLVSESVLLTLPYGPLHLGGVITFGPATAAPADQKLYAVIGDLERLGKNQNYASGADAEDSGVILRINSDGSTPAGDEKGPFSDVPGANASLQRTFAYGIRNSFGIAFDPVTGKLWQTENGRGSYDEINLVEPGFNSGWMYIMGPLSRESFSGAPSTFHHTNTSTYSDPEFSWFNSVAPTSIHFNSSTNIGQKYLNNCFVGDAKTGSMYRFRLNSQRNGLAFSTPGLASDLVKDPEDTGNEILFATGLGITTDIENSPGGFLHSLSLTNSQIYRFEMQANSTDGWQIYE